MFLSEFEIWTQKYTTRKTLIITFFQAQKILFLIRINGLLSYVHSLSFCPYKSYIKPFVWSSCVEFDEKFWKNLILRLENLTLICTDGLGWKNWEWKEQERKKFWVLTVWLWSYVTCALTCYLFHTCVVIDTVFRFSVFLPLLPLRVCIIENICCLERKYFIPCSY